MSERKAGGAAVVGFLGGAILTAWVCVTLELTASDTRLLSAQLREARSNLEVAEAEIRALRAALKVESLGTGK